MAVTDEIVKKARNLEALTNWKALIQYMTPLDYKYVNNEPRLYYINRIGHYYYRRVSESEVHKNK